MFSIIPAVVIFLLTGSLVNRTLWLVTAHLCDNENFPVTTKWGLNLEIMFLGMYYLEYGDNKCYVFLWHGASQ